MMKRYGVWMMVAVVWLGASAARADERGWQYLIDKLVSRRRRRANASWRCFATGASQPFTGLEFSANHTARGAQPLSPLPAAAPALPPPAAAASRHAHDFETAQRLYGVSADVLAAILYVESGCGRNTGSSVIFYRLARLAMANEPHESAAQPRSLDDR